MQSTNPQNAKQLASPTHSHINLLLRSVTKRIPPKRYKRSQLITATISAQFLASLVGFLNDILISRKVAAASLLLLEV